MTLLSTLAERLERATEPDRALDCDLFVATAESPFTSYYPDCVLASLGGFAARLEIDEIPKYTASTDAALALVELKMPGRVWETLHEALLDKRVPMKGDCRMLPICILSSLLAALSSQETSS